MAKSEKAMKLCQFMCPGCESFGAIGGKQLPMLPTSNPALMTFNRAAAPGAPRSARTRAKSGGILNLPWLQWECRLVLVRLD